MQRYEEAQNDPRGMRGVADRVVQTVEDSMAVADVHFSKAEAGAMQAVRIRFLTHGV